MKNKLEALPGPENKVKYINQAWVANAEEFVDDLKNGDVTHGVIIYRKADGGITFRRFAENHSTYLMGLMMKGMIRLGMLEEWEEE